MTPRAVQVERSGQTSTRDCHGRIESLESRIVDSSVFATESGRHGVQVCRAWSLWPRRSGRSAGMQLITVPYVPLEAVVDLKSGHALDTEGEGIMEFLVEFELEIPEEVKASGLAPREEDLAAAAESLAEQGRLIRLWSVPSGLVDDKVLGLYRAKDLNELDDILDNLPFHECVNVVITRLEPHPNDPYRGET